MFQISFLTTYTFDAIKLVDAYVDLGYDIKDIPTNDDEWLEWITSEDIDYDKYCYMKDTEEV